MIVKKIDMTDKQKVVEYLLGDPVRNFFALHILHDPERTSLFVAKEKNQFLGHLSIYTGLSTKIPPLPKSLSEIPFAVALVAEDNEVAEKLLDSISLEERTTLSFSPNLLETIKQKFPEAQYRLEYQMYLIKGNENLITTNAAKLLDSKHATMLSRFYSELKRPMTKEASRKLLKNQKVFGICLDQKLQWVAVPVKMFAGLYEIRVIIPSDYCLEFAMVTSAATEYAIQNGKVATIFVGSDKLEALNTCERLGYKRIEWYSTRI